MKKLTLISLFSVPLIFSACSDKSVEPVEFTPREPLTIRVPGDASNILAGLEMAEYGDTVLVSNGIYKGLGNRDLYFPDKRIILMSENGPSSSVIDCMGNSGQPHFAFRFNDVRNVVIIKGFTIRGGYSNHGAAIYCMNSSPYIENCVFDNNNADISGAHVWCKSSSPEFKNCTFVRGSAATGGAFFISAGSNPVLDNCIIAFAESGRAIATLTTASTPVLSCCLIYGNEGGDWIGSIADQLDQRGNLNLSPLFCEYELGDFSLSHNSPCLPDNNHCGALIGALEAGCLQP